MQQSKVNLYWQAVHAKQREVEIEHQQQIDLAARTGNPEALDGQSDTPGTVYVTSIADQLGYIVGGKISIVDYRGAAVLVINNSHRISTAREIAAYLAEQEERRASYARREAAIQQKTILTAGITSAPTPKFGA